MRGATTKKGGAWYLVIDLGRDETGRRRQRWISGSTRAPWMPPGPAKPWTRKEQAEAALPHILLAVQEGSLVEPSKITVANYLRDWISRAEYRPTTLALFQTQIDAYVIPCIGNLRLQQVKERHLSEFYRRLRDTGGRRGQGLSRKSVQNVHSLLRAAFQDAVREELLLRNPAINARLPRFDLAFDTDPSLSRAHTPAEIDRFLIVARAHRLFAMWVLALAAGIRRGEVIAFRWLDFDPITRSLAIRRSRVMAGRVPQWAPPKTPSSNRVIDLPDQLVALLNAHRARQAAERLVAGSAWADEDLIFCNEDGTPLHPEVVLRITKRLFHEAGLEGNVRALRHFFTTQGERLRVDPKVLSVVLGHTSPATTLKHYQRPDADMKRGVIEQVAATLIEGSG